MYMYEACTGSSSTHTPPFKIIDSNMMIGCDLVDCPGGGAIFYLVLTYPFLG